MANNWGQSGTIRTLSNKESLPAFGHPGEMFYCADIGKLVVWADDKDEWVVINKALSDDLLYEQTNATDLLNDRRGAIRDQKAKKAAR